MRFAYSYFVKADGGIIFSPYEYIKKKKVKKMKRSIALWQMGGVAFTAVLGTLLHFLYGWTGKNVGVAPFAAVNESTWEHMKLFFVPALLFAAIQSRFFRDNKGFWWIKLLGILLGLTLIPALFYTIKGAFGVSPAWWNILLFVLATGSAYGMEGALLKRSELRWRWQWIAVVLLAVLGAAFVFFTFAPPDLPLFQDPTLKDKFLGRHAIT